jgi:4-alpha-glucanotransferase
MGIRHHHGIVIPLSSLHSKHSCGIGEFLDLLPMIDWCKRLKMDIIQLLPLNHSETDPSPYNTFSSCALNIIYLSLAALPYLEKEIRLRQKLEKLSKLSTANRVNYKEVFLHKIDWLRSYFDVAGNTLMSTDAFKQYVRQNPWVQQYARYRSLLGSSADGSFHTVLQYLAFTQLKAVKSYANQQEVFLMGDLPILMGKESVDVWQYPDLFITHLEAGAPPDYYNKEGQNWGFPLFAWDAMKKKQFSWWKQRLHYAENFFDLFRLDHVMGFFRIWAIPPGKLPKEGRYLPTDEKQWGPQGKEILHMICTATAMLPVGEDLGTVPDMVRPTLSEMGICGTKVMRWEREWKEKDHHYIPIQNYPPISLACVSTHDSETLTLWWKNFEDEAKAFAQEKQWNYAPELTQKQREEILWECHHCSSLLHVNLLQEYLAFFPELIWPNPEDERINIPGKFLPTNWTYRFRPSVEEITAHKELFLKIEKILAPL